MKKKLTAVALVVCMLAIMLVGASLAYFTDKTETKNNTFTVGNVKIKLDEPNWNENQNGKFVPGSNFAKDPTITVDENSEDCYVFMKLTVNEFNSWLRLNAIRKGCFEYFDSCNKCGGTCQGHMTAAFMEYFTSHTKREALFDEWFEGINHSEWQIMNVDDIQKTIYDSWENKNTIHTLDIIVGYKTALTAKESKTLFTSVKMPTDIKSKDIADSHFGTQWNIGITGYAIQANNLPDADKDGIIGIADAYAVMSFTAE